MATAYGSVASGWYYKAFLTYTVSSTSSAVTIKVTNAGPKSTASSSPTYGSWDLTVSATDKASYKREDIQHSLSPGASWNMVLSDQTFTYQKGKSAKTVTLKAKVQCSTGSSTASVQITIPALASYKVTYNANGGSGAPASQTKYYGTALTLSSVKPTRTGYVFKRWNTQSGGGGTNYNPSASYTGNSALTLYAVWELAHVAPTITDFVAARDETTKTTVNVSFDYAFEAGAVISASLDVAGTTYAVQLDGSTGNCTITGFATTSSGDVTLTLRADYEDGTIQTVTVRTFISSESYIFKVNPAATQLQFGVPVYDADGHGIHAVDFETSGSRSGALKIGNIGIEWGTVSVANVSSSGAGTQVVNLQHTYASPPMGLAASSGTPTSAQSPTVGVSASTVSSITVRVASESASSLSYAVQWLVIGKIAE